MPRESQKLVPSREYTSDRKELHTVDGIEILLGFIMQLLGFLLELLEATLGVAVHRILGLFTEVELDLELLWRADDALLEALETHDGPAEER